ncbi:HXXEE domain-containing protein [Bacillus cereus]|uniref:HXXEE domain-containing protein n=1 Tax=Bacillus cereus TaxID=1396 RepID=UPI00187A2BE0|nr:HXXEE domain-containing protein [Bacillus cereus]MBE7124062.1 HXXEE domain-containing protein [Bacillus cereus]
MFKLELYNAIWLFVVVFMLHDFEEIITVEKWAKRKESKIKAHSKWINNKIWDFWNINSQSFAKRDVFIFLFMSIITFIKVQYLENSWSSILFLCFLTFVLLHNIVHVLQTIFVKTYTPGLYTAVFLVTPYTIYILYRLREASLI